MTSWGVLYYAFSVFLVPMQEELGWSRAALVAEFYGPASYGSISGMLGLFLTGARALAPVGTAWGHDIRGSYGPVLWTLAVVSAIGAVAVLLAETSTRRLASVTGNSPDCT